MSDLDVLLEQKAERIEKPTTSWRNWYRATALIRFIGGKEVVAGEIFCGVFIWPSKDAAETRMAQDLVDPKCAVAASNSRYLGAFPEGTRP